MAQQVEAPRRQPRSSGIKTVTGDFVRTDRLLVTEGAGGLAWEDAVCGVELGTSVAGCYDLDTVPAELDFTSINQHTSIAPPFALYAGVRCFLGGDSDGESYEQSARRKLELLEERGVEARLWSWVAAATGTISKPDIKQAIAEAEEYADANYIGRPVLMMSRAMATLAHDFIKRDKETGLLTTELGSFVIATSSIPSGDQDTIGVLGMPAVYATEALSTTAPDIRGNLGLAAAFRSYAIGVDCDFRYTITVATTP